MILTNWVRAPHRFAYSPPLELRSRLNFHSVVRIAARKVRSLGEETMRHYVETLYQRHVEEFTTSVDFVRLEEGRAQRADYDHFIGKIFETHQASPRFLGFLFSVVPPGSEERIKHNLLEELGLDQVGNQSHPALLELLIRGAGLENQLDELKHRTRQRLVEQITEPVLFSSLREVGFSALIQIVAFEYMLSRAANRIAGFLRAHRGIAEVQLTWFIHHSEVDIRHAEEGLDSIIDYVDYYDFDTDEARDITDTALRENLFIKRYFGAEAAARARGIA